MSHRDGIRHVLLVMIAGSIASIVGGGACMTGVMIMLAASWVFECIRDENIPSNQ